MSNTWFFHDAFSGHVEYFDTEKEAYDAAEESIGDGSDGWDQEILDGAIKIGLVLFESAEGDHRDTENPDWSFECDVDMAEVECSKVEDLEKEITLLKSELSKERDRVDEFILMNEHADFCRFKYGEECSDQCMSNHYHLDNQLKLARETQKQRKIEL